MSIALREDADMGVELRLRERRWGAVSLEDDEALPLPFGAVVTIAPDESVSVSATVWQFLNVGLSMVAPSTVVMAFPTWAKERACHFSTPKLGRRLVPGHRAGWIRCDTSSGCHGTGRMDQEP